MVIRWAISSTLAGSVRDTIPEGIQVSFSGLSILTFADGKVVEGWDFYHAMDLQEMMLKMGYTVIPPEAGAS
jgi:predicted ester cyclase